MNIALIGYGKMGKAIEETALKKGHKVAVIISSADSASFRKEILAAADIAIEFTGPEAAYDYIDTCLDWGIPVVSGSTGWTSRLPQLEEKCRQLNGAFIYASNFSVAVNIFFELNKTLARIMASHPDYEVLLEEIHHSQKKDAPSGTAITLADEILKYIKRKKQWVNDLSDHPEDLEIISQRVDSVPGTHLVKYASAIDDIEIIHTAHNRMGFASGAVLAAEFLMHHKGCFSMKDVLNL